jgi:DNA-binding LytR/AlgR family response regulator
MDDYMGMVEASEEESVLLQTNNGIERIRLNDILYFVFESKKKVLLQTKKERIIVKENLSDIYERLDKTHFYQTRRDSIVNLRQVQKLQNEYVIIMKDGTMMPLAQKKKEDFMTRLTSEFVDDMKGRKI